jgi:hypothetical protein
MPNFDGTGPQGRGSGTGRLRGKCAAGRGNNKNFPGRRQGRRNFAGNKVRGTGGGGVRVLNNSDNPSNK